VWVDVGARDEHISESGVSHLIEHMLFKGTKRRSARDIASSLESLGGHLNAFTSREQTCYTARVLDEHLDEAIDVLADMTGHATLTPTNLKREKLVILEEIKESLENPSDHIHDLFAQSFWRGHPLGQPILGPAETVASMQRAQVVKYIDRHYRNGSIVIAASGSVSHNRLLRLVREKFDFPLGTSDRGEPARLASDGPHLEVVTNDNQQVHACLGFPGFAYRDRSRLPFMLLMSHLGGGMSSVLFQKVREQKGLAYSIFAYHDSYRDSGLQATYLATDQDRLGEALRIILKELRRVKKQAIDSTRLERIKSQLKGNLVLGMESTTGRMTRMARLELMLGKYVGIDQTMKEIDAVTAVQLQELARQAFDESHMTITALGPTQKKVIEDAI
jgi:predicted Zn-dependent peptidase